MAAIKKKRTRQQTIADFKSKLESSLQDWAKQEGFSLGLVYSVTRGQNKGRRGKGREVLERMESAL